MVYKIAYSSKYNLQKALINKGILKGKLSEDENGKKVARVHGYAEGTHAVVYLGHILLEAGEYDSEGNETKAPVLSDKYHADIMVEGTFDFGSNNEGDPSSPVHKFETV